MAPMLTLGLREAGRTRPAPAGAAGYRLVAANRRAFWNDAIFAPIQFQTSLPAPFSQAYG